MQATPWISGHCSACGACVSVHNDYLREQFNKYALRKIYWMSIKLIGIFLTKHRLMKLAMPDFSTRHLLLPFACIGTQWFGRSPRTWAVPFLLHLHTNWSEDPSADSVNEVKKKHKDLIESSFCFFAANHLQGRELRNPFPSPTPFLNLWKHLPTFKDTGSIFHWWILSSFFFCPKVIQACHTCHLNWTWNLEWHIRELSLAV